jgi:hypothetical protein
MSPLNQNFQERGKPEAISQRTDNTIAKRKLIYKTLDRKLKIKQHEHHKNYLTHWLLKED